MGFCSDPCPQICRQCNKGELEEILSGFETPEDFKLVLLVDCGHVIESRRMDMWLNQTGKEGKIKKLSTSYLVILLLPFLC